MIKKIIYLIIAGFLFVLGKVLLQGDYSAFLQWWAVLAAIGIIYIPFASMLFPSFHDKGYLFSKAIGLALTGYILWFLSSLHILKFTPLSCVISLIIGLLCNIGLLLLFIKKQRGDKSKYYAIFDIKSREWDHIIFEELLFFALFLLFTYVRGFKPEAYGTEKFMDYGFMTSMMRSDFMPPQDFWFSGTKLNYYYVGQFYATFLTKLSAVKVALGYNLMLMMVGAFAFVLPYSLIYNVISQFSKFRGKVNSAFSFVSGMVAGVAVCFAGNMHYPTYHWFQPWFQKFFGLKVDKTPYWFPDATRFIGYHPETHDKTIHEFPAYSFVLGDLHAHVVNVMFVVTILAILFAWMCARKEKQNESLTLVREICNPSILMVAFFIGLFHTTNFWDFPIYFIVSGSIILFMNLVVYNFKRRALGITALQGILVVVLSEIVSLPFTLNFDQISTAPMLCVAHTPLNQLIILWGLPVFMVFTFLCIAVSNFSRKKAKEKAQSDTKEHTGEKIEDNSKQSTLAQFMKSLPVSDLFVITIGLCAIGLVLLPEIIYIQDIYNGDYKRANTMFKLTYQAFIMFGLSFGYIFTRLIIYGEKWRQRKVAIIGFILFAMSVCYIQNAVHSWYGNIFDKKGYKGIDCTTFMQTTFKDDARAIDWLNKHVKGMPVVLEANGDSYTDYQRVSVMTGLPTILGWRTHEWLWKSDTDKLDERAADIETIYTSTDKNTIMSLLKQYNVSYLYMGKLEKEKFPKINDELLKSLGDVVYDNSSSKDKAYETYIVEIKY